MEMDSGDEEVKQTLSPGRGSPGAEAVAVEEDQEYLVHEQNYLEYLLTGKLYLEQEDIDIIENNKIDIQQAMERKYFGFDEESFIKYANKLSQECINAYEERGAALATGGYSMGFGDVLDGNDIEFLELTSELNSIDKTIGYARNGVMNFSFSDSDSDY
tara:strand:- start:189 stop:665 length:477 start_codon:yes stop_codon:yes gene_type:complete